MHHVTVEIKKQTNCNRVCKEGWELLLTNFCIQYKQLRHKDSRGELIISVHPVKNQQVGAHT